MAENRTTSFGEEKRETVCAQIIPGDAFYMFLPASVSLFSRWFLGDLVLLG
jgi:hypothetical protein